MRYLLIGCEVLLRELADAVARSSHTIDVEFLPKGLHDLGGERMREALQTAVDRADPERYAAVLMGYALCGLGLNGLEARRVPLVAPRAHDCIALLMGSRQRYDTYFKAHGGVFFRSTGWLERGRDIEQLARAAGTDFTLADLIAKYGEDNGRYLYEEFTSYQKLYGQLTFIETGLECDDRFEQDARAEAVEKDWAFEKITGDLGLFRKLVDGEWDPADFLVVAPGERIAASYDDGIIKAERIAGSAETGGAAPHVGDQTGAGRA
jgi:hypothetical protein